jgi:hypothetical protein
MWAMKDDSFYTYSSGLINLLTAMLNLFEDWISKTKEKGNKRIGIGKRESPLPT